MKQHTPFPVLATRQFHRSLSDPSQSAVILIINKNNVKHKKQNKTTENVKTFDKTTEIKRTLLNNITMAQKHQVIDEIF